MKDMDFLKDVPAHEREAVERRLEKAQDPRTSPFELKALSKDPHWFIRNSVASNPGTPGGTLCDLTYDPDHRVQEEARRTLERAGMDLSDYKLPLLGHIHAAEVRKRAEMASVSGRETRVNQER